ncbi:MAG: hypothetical protein ACJ796_07790 [Gemmatimonadaceae bacterium]
MSSPVRWKLLRRTLVACLPLAGVACVLVSISSGTQVRGLDPNNPYDVKSPVKAHLRDGSTVVYDDGIRVKGHTLTARRGGRRIGVLNEPLPLEPIPFDSVVGLETFERDVNGPASTLVSAVTMSVSFVVDVAAAVLIFGSCPTIYADSAGKPALQAEIFARRISPLLEARDIDLLHTRADSAGVVTLDVRNEALETHYINHLELLEVRHDPRQQVIPDEHGRPLVVGDFSAPVSARDRANRDVRATLARTDRDAFITDSTVLARATGEDPGDYIDLAFPRPAGDSAVIGLELRSSLLNTVLLYDLMLAAPGARSIDWLQRDMHRIGPMIQFGRWYRKNFGLRVAVRDGQRWREIERHPTYGPVAWRRAATVVPVLEEDSLRVRLSFTADEWRIDWVGMSEAFTRPRPRLIGVTRVRADNDSLASLAKRNLRAADDRYVQTQPGDRFWVSFDVGPAPKDSTRTFLLASQGYYIEWIRGNWLKRDSGDVNTFVPSSASLEKALHLWASQRDSADQKFYSTRVPMRKS